MTGEDLLGDHSRPRTWSRNRTVRNSKMKGNIDNVVVIDVDGDGSDNVVIIDVPDPKLRPNKGERLQVHGIISIDDDDDDVGNDHTGTGVEIGVDLPSDTNSSKSGQASDQAHKPMDIDDDECRVVQEESSSFKSSKCTRTNNGKNPCSNHYGLNEESKGGSSDSDWSDCEVVEGAFGKVHKEWEKAYLKRKFNVVKGKSRVENQASPSSFNNCNQQDIDANVDIRTRQYAEGASCSNTRNENLGKKSFSAFIPTNGGDSGTDPLDPGLKDLSAEPDSIKKMHSSPMGADMRSEGETLLEDPTSSPSKCSSCKHGDDVGGNFQYSKEPSSWSNCQQAEKQCHFMHEDQNDTVHCCFQGLNRQHSDSRKTKFEDEEPCPATASCCTPPRNPDIKGAEFVEEEKLISTEPMMSGHDQATETGVEHVKAPSDGKTGAVFEESSLRRSHLSGIPEVPIEKADERQEENSVDVGAPLSSSECVEIQKKQGSPCSVVVEERVMGSTSSNQLNSRWDKLDAETPIPTLVNQGDIINKREKLKETDEYKRAMEEEWASRQRQLKIQAEEAQRLRKKRRAESLRLLEMERRQRQRLEEIRETEKKDAENMNLKMQLRAEVRKELNRLETTCLDMASLLRGLGIHVGGGFQPLSHEVHAAYKRALLKFHPDRASKTNIRQQVEAEEKFKLISRMKEKFLATPPMNANKKFSI